jgi:hypothetical protein
MTKVHSLTGFTKFLVRRVKKVGEIAWQEQMGALFLG